MPLIHGTYGKENSRERCNEISLRQEKAVWICRLPLGKLTDVMKGDY